MLYDSFEYLLSNGSINNSLVIDDVINININNRVEDMKLQFYNRNRKLIKLFLKEYILKGLIYFSSGNYSMKTTLDNMELEYYIIKKVKYKYKLK